MKIYGTVKIHGTNAAVALNCSTGEMYTQSRNRLISIEDDNAGFAQYVYTNRDFYRDALEEAKKRVPDAVTILIYGEWAGGNIQKGVAITGVEKVKAVEEFVKYAVTENRLEQGIQYMNEMHIPVDTKHTSDFIKWVTSDVYKEELDTVVENGLEWKSVTKSVANAARKWFMTKC